MWIDLKKNTNTNKSDMQGIFFFLRKTVVYKWLQLSPKQTILPKRVMADSLTLLGYILFDNLKQSWQNSPCWSNILSTENEPR